MRIAREIELRLERIVDGLSAVLFRGKMHPVDLANRLVRYVDLSVRDGATGPHIANRYLVRVGSSELGPEADVHSIEMELAAIVGDTAQEHGWRIGGPIEVEIRADDRVASGAIKCVGEHRPGPIPAWAQLIDARAGKIHDIGDNRVSIGRASECDVQIDHPRVSRNHALLTRQGRVVRLRDDSSSNGTTINGTALGPAETRVLQPGDAVAFGPATFSFRLL